MNGERRQVVSQAPSLVPPRCVRLYSSDPSGEEFCAVGGPEGRRYRVQAVRR